MPLQMHLDNTHPETDQNHQQFVVEHPGLITVVGHHLKTSTAKCRIRAMSVAGAVLDVDTGADVPNHFFLEIVGIKDEIGCTLIKHEGQTVLIGFNMLLNEEFLHHVLRLAFEVNS